MEQERQTVLIHGVPTGPDVKKIMDAFPDIQVGQIITHAEIEAVTGLMRKTSRYSTVTKAWKDELLDKKDIEMKAEYGQGFKRLNPQERIESNIDVMHQGIRKVKRGARRVGIVQTDDPVLMHKRDTAVRSAAVLDAEHLRMKAEIRLPPPATQNPRAF